MTDKKPTVIDDSDPFTEGRLKFSFSGVMNYERFDPKGKKTGQGLKKVDFIVEEEACLWLIEVKSEENRSVSDMLNDKHIYKIFVPKARDTYTCLHLMERDNKPFNYIVVFDDIDFHYSDYPKLERMKGRLYERLAHELDTPWKRQYIKEAFIVGASKVASYLSFCQVERKT
jgi:hypothetical protein